MFKTLLPLGLGLLAIGALTFLCANRHRPEIEFDLTERTKAALASITPSAAVSAEGQIISLKGAVPTEEAKFKAGEEAAKVFGVSEVNNLLEVKGPSQAVMTPEVRQTAVTCQAEFTDLLKRDEILFETAKADISPASHHLLDGLATAAAKCPAVQFEVGGHTDSTGVLELNMKLSQSRAQAVMNYLAAKGVSASRMTAAGYGPTKPIASNETSKGKQQNRRTEFKVKGL